MMIGDHTNIWVHVANISEVDENEYALLRKNTIGASDMSSLFGIGFGTREALLNEKRAKYITDAEKAIHDKPNVRKGRDLEEPIIRPKVAQALGLPLEKPADMYRLKQADWVTINYDAVAYPNTTKEPIPVELKYVTTFATKNWKNPYSQSKAPTVDVSKLSDPTLTTLESKTEYITQLATIYGIPAYYLTQVQTQIMGLKAPFGYLGALFEKTWDVALYKIYADARIQIWCLEESAKAMKELEQEVNPTIESTETFEY